MHQPVFILHLVRLLWPSPASPGGSKVMYAIKRMEQEMAWEERGY